MDEHAGGDESYGRRKVEPLNPLDGETHTQGMYLDRYTRHKIGNKKMKVPKKYRRRAQPDRWYDKQRMRHMTRARSRTGELNVATWNVRSLSLTGTVGPGMPR